MKQLHLAVILAITALTYGQTAPAKSPDKAADKTTEKPADKKQYVFHGKVESVDKVGNYVSASNEKIEGWMEAMSMVYPVDDVSILDRLKPGDQITATVFEGDYSLHQIKVVAKDAERPKSETKK